MEFLEMVVLDRVKFFYTNKYGSYSLYIVVGLLVCVYIWIDF